MSDWKPAETLPVLQPDEQWLSGDWETTGVNVHQDLPVGLAVHLPLRKQSFYLPFGHRGGGNLDESLVKRWCQTELRGRHLVGLNSKFEHHVGLNWGLDLEAQGCQLHDVAYQAALLNETRRTFNLEDLSQEFLGRGKVKLDGKENIHERPAGEVGPYAERDAELAWALHDHLMPKVEAEDLTKVLDLEDRLIYPVVRMERQGVLLDVAKLAKWRTEVRERYSWCILEIFRLTKLRVNPNSGKDLSRLFQELRLNPGVTAAGAESFTETYLMSLNHPVINLVMEARQLDSLDSKYLKKYQRAVGSGDILRYALHQLRNDEYGTVTGRFSSANVNITQVFKEDRQDKNIEKWIIRELFLPRPGRTWVKADASQIEFRVFAHYTQSPQLIKKYNDDPDADFHAMVAELCNLPRTPAKNINFGKVFGMGRGKMKAQMVEYALKYMRHKLSEAEFREKFSDAAIDRMFDKYDERVPEVRRLMNRVMRVAEERGYVRTFLGRRRRYPTRERLHSALNAVIQGTAADILKLKILEVDAARKALDLTLFYPVHDELDGDLGDPGRANELKTLLEQPAVDLRVPILWQVSTGKTWSCDEK